MPHVTRKTDHAEMRPPFERNAPAAHAVVPPFAGVAGLSPLRTLIPLSAASGVWYGALTWAAVTLINEVDDVARFMAGINRTGLLALGVVLAMAVAYFAFRWQKKRRATR